MAGIIFWQKIENIEKDKVQEAFSSLDYKKGKELQYGDWQAVIFPKTDYDIENYLELDDGFICCTGTFAYKGMVYEKSLPILYKDIKTSNLNIDDFWGAFLIFAVINGKTTLIRDGAYLARLHRLRDKKVFSNSFSGLLRVSPTKCSINKEGVTQLFSTGVITGSSTIVNEIDFIHKSYLRKGLIENYLISKAKPINPVSNLEEALNQQIVENKKFISKISEDWFKYIPKSHLNLSITGGLDTRLLTAITESVTNNFDFYTFWRSEESGDQDFPLAKNIAEKLDKKLNYIEFSNALDKDDKTLLRVFTESHNSCDGVIRPGTFWDEESTSIKYRSKLSYNPYLRLTGFEGEYYRNMEKLPHKSMRSYKSWVRWDMIYRFAGDNFIKAKDRNKLVEKIVHDIENQIGKGTFNLFSFKNYYREMLVPSYRSFQVNIENRHGFVVNPFADTIISTTAKNAYPYLGDSLFFEVEMLRNISKKLAALPSDYGFNFNDGVPKSFSFTSLLWQKIPSFIKHPAFAFYRKYYRDSLVKDLAKKSPLVTIFMDNINDLDLPIDIDAFASRRVRGKLVLNVGFFIYINKTWLK